MTNKPNKVAIVGSAGTTADKAPFKDPSFEIWGLAWRKYERCDRYFDIHTLGPHRKKVPQNYEGFMKEHGKPVYLQQKNPNIPNSLHYPLDSAIEFLSSFGMSAEGEYFVSSIAYMLVLAMMEGFKEIHIYGVDLLADDEWSYQRPNTEYIIGLARGMGIQVYIPQESALCKYTYMYGYDDVPEELITRDVINERLKEHKDKHEKALAELYTRDGAIQELNAMSQLFDYRDRGGYVEHISRKDK